MEPAVLEACAADLAGRAARRKPATLLEVAAGAGMLTRRLATTLPPSTILVATHAGTPARLDTERPVEWRQADATALPFEDKSFDVVACQFGVADFGDTTKAFAEIRRVLLPGGVFIFNFGDRTETCMVAHDLARGGFERLPTITPVEAGKAYVVVVER